MIDTPLSLLSHLRTFIVVLAGSVGGHVPGSYIQIFEQFNIFFLKHFQQT